MTDLREAYLVTGVRTPIGRYGGALATVRPDDLAAHVIRALTERLPTVDWAAIDDVVLGCANQAGEDNRNVARMATLLAGLPETVSASTVNRLCGSGLDAVAIGARAIRTGEAELVVAGGVESMSRAPFVMGKSESAFARQAEIFDTTLGWRFVNPRLNERYGTDSMTETAENVAVEYDISRADQDLFALRSQERAARAVANGRFAEEIVSVEVPGRKRRDRRRGPRRAPASNHDREVGGAADAIPRGRLHHGRQRLRGERRGGGAAAGLGGRGGAPRADTAGPGCWRGRGRRAAPDHGHRAGAGHPQAAG
jgi:acetyl-CoA acetyltransferase family protein